MASTGRQWNWPCALINRAPDFRLAAGWTLKRWQRSSYCQDHARRFCVSLRIALVLIRPFKANGVLINLVTQAQSCLRILAPGSPQQPPRTVPHRADTIVRATSHFGLSNCTDCSSAKTVPTKTCASMRSTIRSASSDTQIVARRNFRCGSSSRCLPTRFNCKSRLIAL
jgi:hypothetical protein